MRTETTKAITAEPYDGKPAWHGRFKCGHKWFTVRNSAGLPIAYATERAAIDGARYAQSQMLHARYAI